MNKNDGGPAFPFAATDGHNVPLQTNGMSLRDWFAGQALMGLVAADLYVPDTLNGRAHVAAKLYAMADAMLAERAKGGE